MKIKWLVIGLLLGIVGLCAGIYSSQPVTFTADINPTTRWENLGSITVQNATFAVNARDFSTIGDIANTNIIDVNLPTEGVVHEFRFRTDADGNAHVVELWLAPSDTMDGGLEEVYQHGLTASLTGGTGDAYKAAGSSYGDSHFVDTISVTDEGILEDAYQVVNSGGNDQAILRVRTRGNGRLAVIATTLQGSTTLLMDGRQYSK